MPVQRTFLGRPIAHISPRRMVVILGTIATFAVITLIFTLPNSIPSGSSLGRLADHRMSLPKLPKQLPSPSILNPFRQVAHAPPVQKNSTYGESKWHANWNWLSPFSSSVTLDENRSLLPPLAERQTIYTYYDHTLKKDEEVKAAENALLVTWRRAWWAQGFKPIILSPAEAMNNPLYLEMQRLELGDSLKVDLTRWLAWQNMGNGFLCNYLTLPMGPYEDQTLSYLRRGEYPSLTRYDELGSGIFSGSKADITAAVKAALANPKLKDAKDFVSAVPKDTFKIDPSHDSLAFYQPKIVEKKYPQVAKGFEGNGAAGLQLLNKLITSHLHQTWQNIFNNGISVVKPEPQHTSYLVEPALQLAEYLAQCPNSPMPASCPPNRPKCTPCVASSPMKISTPAFYRNTSGLYTIGTVPHPYTMSMLISFQEKIDIRWIRRESPRDAWLSTLTKELLGTGVSGSPRIIKFKEAVASGHGTSHSLWLTAEKEVPSDLDWHFGFAIPRNATDTGKSETPVPGPERRPKPVHDPKDGPVPTEADKKKEELLLEKARTFGRSENPEDLKIRGAVEAWNLADTEAWRFARAFLARSRVERLKWEEEEKRYAGGAGAERGKESGWGRWFDD
ncbi:hypothetical protein DSL72_002085 [Monilinia vaccinii-corymbosi]|uniref:Uncharacterized protein n=1 Tax=Monilinia vaccinii-corymbosi TaxID=61207 RepID=A0A8A3PBP4_9HELO|nr:hypothetical protein DSL72_002085 [Monilinia vaccinii-corymbosi]